VCVVVNFRWWFCELSDFIQRLKRRCRGKYGNELDHVYALQVFNKTSNYVCSAKRRWRTLVSAHRKRMSVAVIESPCALLIRLLIDLLVSWQGRAIFTPRGTARREVLKTSGDAGDAGESCWMLWKRAQACYLWSLLLRQKMNYPNSTQLNEL